MNKYEKKRARNLPLICHLEICRVLSLAERQGDTHSIARIHNNSTRTDKKRDKQ